jgi:hypothetical protein
MWTQSLAISRQSANVLTRLISGAYTGVPCAARYSDPFITERMVAIAPETHGTPPFLTIASLLFKMFKLDLWAGVDKCTLNQNLHFISRVILSLCAASAILSLHAYSPLGLARTALHFLSTEGVYTRFPASVRIASTLCAFAALFFLELYDGRIHLVHNNTNTPTGLLLSSLLVHVEHKDYESIEEMARAITEGRVRLAFASIGSAYYRDIFTHNSETMSTMKAVSLFCARAHCKCA